MRNFRNLLPVLVSAIAVGAFASFARAEVTLPSPPVSVGDYVTAWLPMLGTALGVIVGAYFTMLIVKVLLSWVSRFFSSRAGKA